MTTFNRTSPAAIATLTAVGCLGGLTADVHADACYADTNLNVAADYQRVVQTASEKGARGQGIRWVELALEYDGVEVLRGLYVLNPETGRWGLVPPGFPDTWQPEGGFPAE